MKMQSATNKQAMACSVAQASAICSQHQPHAGHYVAAYMLLMPLKATASQAVLHHTVLPLRTLSA